MATSINAERINNNSVSYSRAGDVFHYRWAARRCLGLLQPASNLESVFIEGSNESKKAGEYVIDVSEYYSKDSKIKVEYFQLKHSTKQLDNPFTLSGLKKTVVGFSNRYKQHLSEKSLSGVFFTIITNRKIDETFKQNLVKIARGDKVDKRFRNTLKNYTKLEGKELSRFCSVLRIADSEGDYKDQEGDLRVEMSRLQPGLIDPAQVDSLFSLVQKKVLPDSNGKIVIEDILIPFGFTSIGELFPAPPLFEDIGDISNRKQYKDLLAKIETYDQPVIIQAEGGVGKTIFCQYVLKELPEGSLGIAYDCFGLGTYRSRSKSRHNHREALIQIANELASLGLCDSILIKDTTHKSDIMRDFMNRIEFSLGSLRQINESAKLYILIDAADNAEMAAKSFNDSCFAHELLNEEFPRGCKLILLCRPERTHLLNPQISTPLLNLLSFSEEETCENIKKWFPNVSDSQALEFHRLSSGNPRVQMNSIAGGHSTVEELLSFLGPSGTNVEQQIELQLGIAIQKIKNTFTSDYQNNVDKICTGLASLPPNIPIEVLSRASEVRTDGIKSFITDIGRSLWLHDSLVRFRDEPTETWFRNKFLGSAEDYNSYITVLEPLASEITYVAEILPQLYLEAGQYEKLIDIAISDELLPIKNPIDARNVLVYRLQFALKAALRLGKYKDAIKLALRAGEEVAGDHRQLNLLQNNIDLLHKIQDKIKVQEIAFRKLLKGEWAGSENVYTASLLSEINEYRGEASSYLRSSLNWLHLHFEESKNEDPPRNKVSYDEILELAFIHLNLNGPKSCLEFLDRLKPKEFIFQVMKRLTSRLIDSEKFDEINEILKNARTNVFHVVAIVSELVNVGRFAKSNDIEGCLNFLSNPKKRIKKPKDQFNDIITPSIIDFLMVCLHRKMKANKIIEVLDYYIPNVATQGVVSRFESSERKMFLNAISIRCVISNQSEVNLDDIMPEIYKSKETKRDYVDEIKQFNELIGSLFPWFLLRARIIAGCVNDFPQSAELSDENSKSEYAGRYRTHDVLPGEIADITSSILIYCCDQFDSEIIAEYYNKYIKGKPTFNISQRLNLLRAACRTVNLNNIILDLESSTYELINGLKESRPEEISEYYIFMARAVLTKSRDDASVYFDDAINIVSKFGDEVVERWEAIDSLGKGASNNSSHELAYRFIRCAEMVGEYVYREKYWDRSGAMLTCVKMSPQIGISAISRWRDREIGRFESHLELMMRYLINSKEIKPSEGWPIAYFFTDQYLDEFLSACLENESSKKVRHSILLDAYELLSKDGASIKYWLQLKSIADKYQISLQDLDNVVDFYNDRIKEPKISQNHLSNKTRTKSEVKKWERIFQDVDILTTEGINTLIVRFSNVFNDNKNRFLTRVDLYAEILDRIESNMVLRYINLLLSSEKVSNYDFQKIIRSIPDDWKKKVSFKREWPEIVRQFGSRYARDLLNSYSFRSAIKELDIDDYLIIELRKGIFSGISKGQEFIDASLLFQFVSHASALISGEDASEMLEYAISRFELHMEDDFGDGLWDDWLYVPDDLDKCISGLIWSALGSPQSKTRWKACHVVDKLSYFNCTKVLDFLIDWLELDRVDAFGSNQFPFYKLHARQYLFIAFNRISVDNPDILFNHKIIFLKYAQLDHHLLIQKFAAEIALNIEKAAPQSYSDEEIFFLNSVGENRLGVRREGYMYRTDSYWHKKGLVDTNLDYHCAYDFDRYWFEPLGGVFGVSASQIEDLCANVIVNEWKLGTQRGYDNDPRVSLWNRNQDRETWHSHSSYPKTDNLDFYLSYHSMLVVAARLIINMSIIVSRDDEDPWDSWLSRHMLTMKDGKWLSDLRGALPLKRPEWISKEDSNEHWRMDVRNSDFLKSLKFQQGSETWLNVRGGWTERHKTRYETYSISSALVSKETSNALLLAVSSRSNSHDYGIPDYKEGNLEIDSGIFQLKGFIANPYSSKGIDEFDPYGKNISFPPFSIGIPYLKKLKLIPNVKYRSWSLSDGRVVLKCDAWSGDPQGYDEEPEQSGMQLSASLELLKKLCQIYSSHLIIEVSISRDIEYKYRPDDYEYLGPKQMIYIFTEDGRLKNTEKNYRLR